MLQRGLNEQRLVLSEGRRELIKIDLDQILPGVWKSRNPEPKLKMEPEPEPELKLRLGSTETSSRYPCGNKIQDGILCYHCFEKFSAQ